MSSSYSSHNAEDPLAFDIIRFTDDERDRVCERDRDRDLPQPDGRIYSISTTTVFFMIYVYNITYNIVLLYIIRMNVACARVGGSHVKNQY